jgi:hypothetical protein
LLLLQLRQTAAAGLYLGTEQQQQTQQVAALRSLPPLQQQQVVAAAGCLRLHWLASLTAAMTCVQQQWKWWTSL